MLGWIVTFLVIAIIAAVFGFGGIAAGAAGIAKILFFIFLILLVGSVVMHLLNAAPLVDAVELSQHINTLAESCFSQSLIS